MIKTKISTRDRLCDAVGVTLKDLIVKDLLNESDMGIYYGKEKKNGLEKFNFYLDKYEGNQSIPFNFSIDGEMASKTCHAYELFLLSGNNNETGSGPIMIQGNALQIEPDTIIDFEIPLDASDSFSYHDKGRSYANYAVYGLRKDKTKLMLGKGKIYVTDVLFDLTESVLDGQ